MIRYVARQSGLARVATVITVGAVVTVVAELASLTLPFGDRLPIPLATVAVPTMTGICLMTALPTQEHHVAARVRNLSAWNAVLALVGLALMTLIYQLVLSEHQGWGTHSATRNLLLGFELAALCGLGLPSLGSAVVPTAILVASITIGRGSDGTLWWAPFAQPDGDTATLLLPLVMVVPALVMILCAEALRTDPRAGAGSGHRAAVRAVAAGAFATSVVLAPLWWPGWLHYSEERVPPEARPATLAIAGAMVHPTQSRLDPRSLSQIGFGSTMISDSEAAHLAQVRIRIQAGRQLGTAAGVVALSYGLASVAGSPDRRRRAGRLLEWAGAATIGLCALGALASTLGEQQVMTSFHSALFPEGDWTFGTGSVLAQTFGSPGFFSDAARGVVVWVGAVGITAALLGFLMRSRSHQEPVTSNRTATLLANPAPQTPVRSRSPGATTGGR